MRDEKNCSLCNKKYKALISKYVPYVLKYMPCILKYMACIFYNKPCVFLVMLLLLCEIKIDDVSMW